jgi:hypothetical protein
VIPLVVKFFYTLFVCVLVPVYWRYHGLANFLWFSDLALLIGLVAIWLESPLLASMQAISVLLLELLWIVDFLARLVTGKRIIGIAEYMFKPDKPLFVRGLSLFHLALPLFLVWLVYVLEYDPRSWIVQTFFFWTVVLVCYFFTEPSENINWVFGIGSKPQMKISPGLYLVSLMVVIPACVYLPTHFLLAAFMPRRFGV